MTSILEEYLQLCSEEFPKYNFPFFESQSAISSKELYYSQLLLSSTEPAVREFEFVYALVRHGFWLEIVMGQDRFGLHKRFPPGYNEFWWSTNYKTNLRCLYVLIKNDVISHYMDEFSAVKFFTRDRIKEYNTMFIKKETTGHYNNCILYLYFFLVELKWHNTERDIIFNWREIIDHINQNLMSKEIYESHSNFIYSINMQDIDIKLNYKI